MLLSHYSLKHSRWTCMHTRHHSCSNIHRSWEHA